MTAINCTDRQKENLALWQMPTVEGHFPHKFATGNVASTITVTCQKCEYTVPLNALHGCVVPVGLKFLSVSVIGRCKICQRFMRNDVMIDDQLSLHMEKDGRQSKWVARKNSTEGDPAVTVPPEQGAFRDMLSKFREKARKLTKSIRKRLTN